MTVAVMVVMVVLCVAGVVRVSVNVVVCVFFGGADPRGTTH